MQCSLFGLLLLIPAAAAVPTYGSLADFVGEHADDADVINVTRCDAYLDDDFGTMSMYYYSYGGWGTVVCGVDCPETALSYGGCWDTGVTYDTTICTVAKQAGIPVGQRFAYYVNLYADIDVVGCDANGVDGTPGYGTYGDTYKLVLQENIGNSTGVLINNDGDTITSEMFVIDSCDLTGRSSADAEGYFAYYEAEFAYFEMKCSVACNSSHLVENAAGCPDVAANGHLSYCVAAAMLGIPPMSPFVVKYLAEKTVPVAGCFMNGINTSDGSASNAWKIVAANRLTTTSISTTSSTTSGTHTSTTSSATSFTSSSTTSTSATSTSATSTQTATTETSTTTTASTNTATATTATTTTTTTTTGAAVNNVERAGVKLAVLVFWGMLFFV